MTILKPCCGLENDIEETLASTFTLEYSAYEIVFCVARHDDPVVPLIRRLMLEHPRIPARLLIGNDRFSINPKLNNLIKGWHAAAHDWIVVTDSNVLMPPDYVDRLLERRRPGTGLVSSPPVGIRPQGIGAELECAFLNTHQARWLLIADAFGTAFAHGKTLLWRRDDLERAGGFEALAAEPAEDAVFTKLIRAAGSKIHLVIHPFPQPLGMRPLGAVWRRQLRWARLRRRSFPLVNASEVVSGGLLPLAATAALVAAGALSSVWFSGLLIAWYGAEVLLARQYGWPASLRIAVLMVVRDLLLLPLWVLGWAGSKFVWRGSAMDIKTGAAPLRRLVVYWRSSRTVRFAMLLVRGGRSATRVEGSDGRPPSG
ncbi:MAG TPA: ceramide glucosyltransferase [Gammaproteobacteria bacterium]|nr:ceramide glucosyltransferase [Gammaproteobacteria bacterium]